MVIGTMIEEPLKNSMVTSTVPSVTLGSEKKFPFRVKVPALLSLEKAEPAWR